MTLSQQFNPAIHRLSYIKQHKLSNRKIRAAGIDLLPDEIFVQCPRWPDYYISTYGRLLSDKRNRLKLLRPAAMGPGRYPGYNLTQTRRGRPQDICITAHRLMGQTFFKNLWGNIPVEVHHIDHNHYNNHISNLMLLPKNLHAIMDGIHRTALITNGKSKKLSIYQIMVITDIPIDKIILAATTSPIDTHGRYSVHPIDGQLIGFWSRRLPPKTKKRRKKNKKAA